MSFKFYRLEIPDVVMIEPAIQRDDRGFFMETYKQSDFTSFGIKELFVQDNHSSSSRHVLRGLHYQKNPHAQGKLIRILQGEIVNVVVDLRKGSPHYSHWLAISLSKENRRMLYVPVGFANGFCVLSKTADVAYKVTTEYSPDHDAGIIWNDPMLSIKWPVENPVLSKNDLQHPQLKDIHHDFEYRPTV